VQAAVIVIPKAIVEMLVNFDETSPHIGSSANYATATVRLILRAPEISRQLELYVKIMMK
jgi:hypothetical protein